jgi:hypothetical protein
MTRMSKLLILAALALFILACNLVTAPISDVGNVASTAQAFASEMPFETLQALATSVPCRPSKPCPQRSRNSGNTSNPSGTPVEQWNSSPSCRRPRPEKNSAGTHTVTPSRLRGVVQQFYNQKMEELGWTSPFGFQVSEGGGIMFYQKESEFVTITIAPDQNDQNSVDVILQKE